MARSLCIVVKEPFRLPLIAVGAMGSPTRFTPGPLANVFIRISFRIERPISICSNKCDRFSIDAVSCVIHVIKNPPWVALWAIGSIFPFLIVVIIKAEPRIRSRGRVHCICQENVFILCIRHSKIASLLMARSLCIVVKEPFRLPLIAVGAMGSPTRFTPGPWTSHRLMNILEIRFCAWIKTVFNILFLTICVAVTFRFLPIKDVAPLMFITSFCTI